MAWANTYDAAGHLLTVTRQGGAQAMVIQRHAYDWAGRLTGATDALGVLTRYTNYWTNGFFVNQTVYAAGTAEEATRLETYNT